MSSSSWQHPFVNIFKHFDIISSKKSVKQGDVSTVMDRDLKSTVYRIRGLTPANNYIQFPSQSSTQNLCLTGRLFYILFRTIFDKYFCIHIDILTHEQHLIRISLSNLYREFKITQTSIQFPYMTTGTDIHWSVLCLDLHTILLTYMTNEHYHMIKSFQLCGNMFVKNCFSSQFLYEPGIDNDTARRTGLTYAGIRSLPRELSYPIDKGESWHDKYDFIMFPNTSSSKGKNISEPFDKVGNVRLPTPRKLLTNNENSDQIENDEPIPLTVQTTVINGQINKSMTDLAHITQRSASPRDNQLNWRTYNNLVDHFPSLPTVNDSSNNNNNDGIHLFIKPQPTPSSSSIPDDSDYDLALTTDRSHPSNLTTLLPDPILRLRTVIGLTNTYPNLLWTQDGNYILYSSNAIVVQMHVETQQQWFFIGHTDKISAIVFNNNSLLLATIQTGSNAILRLWKFETRRCICAVRVPNTTNLHALDFGIENSSSSIVVVGHDEQSRTVVCVYNTLNVHKGSIELLCRASTDASITHIHFVPYDLTKFISIGLNNIQFWRIKNDNDLKSMRMSINDIDHLEYTDIQFEYLSNNKLNELLVYISTKTGHILELLYDEKRVIKIHYLSDKIITTKGILINICTFICTNHFCIIGSNDGYVRVWSTDFSQVYIEAKYDQAISGLISSYDQTRILISTISGSINILNLVNKAHLNLLHTHTKFITDIDYDDRRKQIITVAQDGTIRIWCFKTGKQISEFTSEREVPFIVVHTPNREIFACGFNNGTIKIFDLNTSIISTEIKHHTTTITGLLYSHNGSCLLSSDEEGNLCLSDANDNYKLQRTTLKALIISQKGITQLSISPDGKHTVYVGPTEFIVTMIETNTLNQTLRIDISSCTFITNDRRSIISTESALFARFTPNRQLLIATTTFKLLKFDSYTGKILNIIDHVHKHSIDSLSISSDNQYLITTGDNLLKFWNANMELDINFQSFVGHSEQIRKVFFTDDNMHVISIGDSIFIWDVLAWSTPKLTMPNNAQCIVPPQSVKAKILEDLPIRSRSNNNDQVRNPVTARVITRSLSNSEIDKTITISQEQKKIINKKLLTKQNNNQHSPSIHRHFIQKINHSQLAKKRYIAPVNQESLKLQSIIGYNGNGRENLVWYPPTGFFAYTVGCNIIVENLTNNHQTILNGHTEEISTMTLANNGTILASAQCSLLIHEEEWQTKIIIWDIKTFRQKFSFQKSVQAIQSMAFSKDDHFLVTIGNYRKPMLTLWSTNDYTNLLNWQDESYLNCLAWNPIRTNEFCLGSSHSTIRFCTIIEQTDDSNVRLQIINGQIPSLINEQPKHSCDITACVYLTSMANLVLCATNYGFITCWNSRVCLCILHWKADLNEICYMATVNNKLLTGSSTGSLKLWNIENIEANSTNSNYGLTIQDEFQLDDGIVSGSFDNTFDMGIVGTSCGSLWYICWTTDRSKTCLVASHTDRITGLVPIEDTHIVTSSLDGTIRIFQLEDRNEILRFNANGLKVTCLTSWDNSIVPQNDLSNSISPMKNIKSTIRSIVAGYDDGTLRIFNLLYGQMVLKLQPHTTSVTAINVPLNTIISLSGASDGSIAISNLVQGLLLRVLNEHRGSAPISIIDSKQLLEKNFYMWLIASHDRRISLWKSNNSFDSCQLIDWLTFSAPSFSPNDDQTKTCQSYPPSLAHFIDTNLLLYTGHGPDKCIQIYHIDKKQIIRTIPLSEWCSCFDLSNIFDNEKSNRLIAIGTQDRLVQLKDYTQGTFQDFIGNNDILSNIKFLGKFNNLLITTSANEIFVWKIVFN